MKLSERANRTTSKGRNEPLDLLLTQFERLLYRLSISRYKEKFVLKGAILLRHWLGDPHRPTRDLDLLGFGESDPQITLGFFKEICETKAEDGLTFDTGSLEVDTVRDDSGSGGLRLKCYATVDGAPIRIVIDVGYGDAAEPGLKEIELLPLLDHPARKLRAYPPETVIAEKFQAMMDWIDRAREGCENYPLCFDASFGAFSNILIRKDFQSSLRKSFGDRNI